MTRLLTTLNVEDAQGLINDKILINSKLNNQDDKFSKMIKRRLKELTGLDEGIITCMQRIDDVQVNLAEHYSDLYEFLDIDNTTLILELKLDDTLCLSMSFDEFILFRNQIEKENDEVLLELLYEEFCELSVFGKLTGSNDIEDSNVITFIPSLELTYCKMFLLLDEDWEGNDYNLGEIPQLKLKRMKL